MVNSSDFQLVILCLETLQAAELRPLLRESYLSGMPIFGELRRTRDGVFLFAGMIDRKAALKVQKLLNPAAKG